MDDNNIVELKNELEKRSDTLRLLEDNLKKRNQDNKKLSDNNQLLLKKIKLLESKIASQKPEKVSFANNIKFIKIDLYHVVTKVNPKCPYCEKFKELGVYTELQNFGKKYGLSGKFQFVEWKCDWNDIKYHDEYSYDLSLSVRGKNWLYATGKDVEYFPTVDVSVWLKNGDFRFDRIAGLGSHSGDGKIKVDTIARILDFLKNINKRKIKDDSGTRVQPLAKDALLEKKVLRDKYTHM
jgi:hypothetical protein